MSALSWIFRRRWFVAVGVLMAGAVFFKVSCQSYGWLSKEARTARWAERELSGTFEAIEGYRSRFGTYPEGLSELDRIKTEEHLVTYLDSSRFPFDGAILSGPMYRRMDGDSFVLGFEICHWQERNVQAAIYHDKRRRRELHNAGIDLRRVFSCPLWI